ncbi:mRNA cleavage and polyadenylation specificity factor-like protein [Haloterrigena alkaliphila]|uniref:mRNA cleavage and polyadenylation specificity factor-like protein n=1 Tax=Haloterrigena alkaliphila TaxID=2816475 RepID=UPI001CED1891|nr:mRNA cleavage and polyadenylation specificity factor-like protein [Haloterrigena alkaliphila]QSX01116.2 mRNA cleavage and polyadenylation specificity factor-like protein [Haloterrigena alkaliphila]
MTVRHRDGIHFEREADPEPSVVADARSAVGAINVVSHAHADHTFRSAPETVVCSAETAAIAEARTGRGFEFVESAPGVDLVPAGHVVGSRAALFDLEDGASGDVRRYCYTGDFSTRERCYLEGFDPDAVDADVLVMETTYGLPKYRFPSQDALEAEIGDWIRDNADRPLFCFGYSLGRAQKLQWIAREATGGSGGADASDDYGDGAGADNDDGNGSSDCAREILVSDSIHDVNEAIETATDGDLAFSGRPYDSLRDLTDEIVILPSNQARADWVETAVEREGALKAGFSGWAVDDSFLYRGNYDVTFPLTDHCDFDELLETVRAIDPDVVYTHHGFDEAFADRLETEYGYRARPLKREQTTLEEFC